LVLALAAAGLAGLGHPVLDLLLKCRAPFSEACVWARAYLPLTLGLELLLVGIPVFLLAYWLLGRSQRRGP
jgi:hypothetical protein